MDDDRADRIVHAVPCPVCLAERGQYCRNTVTDQSMMRPGVVVHAGRVILFERGIPEVLA